MSISSNPPTRSGHKIFPTWLPVELGIHQIFQRYIVEIVLEGPIRGDMPNDQHPRFFPAQVKIIKKAPDSLNRLPPIFARGIGFIQMVSSRSVKFGSRHAILLPVVAFSQAPIMENGYR